ncbi:hypothetical protein NEUTE1DRAFT_116150 [Neurospora tetrasperma FGSC 2508]|uniref:Uncharacterized protein n=1 Tax=Neurospora tetrasperma (strain FGSC 2508 / ATCC MYA-4615 / P0657) TaxID=510951 RepID=F8ME24_NEUT8|nr:uncharacterized protein NEUTE1DRAFT_116150 [Neurospora tetrasperma FGSC 2508]EGO61559.1 hypothetical protein NEUTE1DRAFT_116150 [Neurospora tetrasperma FGSC 2508]EGZ74400.1 hypothetical protein NEUTE2DRAFT_143334 [Neurospora tetrasperma FGSC 2509]
MTYRIDRVGRTENGKAAVERRKRKKWNEDIKVLQDLYIPNVIGLDGRTDGQLTHLEKMYGYKHKQHTSYR